MCLFHCYTLFLIQKQSVPHLSSPVGIQFSYNQQAIRPIQIRKHHVRQILWLASSGVLAPNSSEWLYSFKLCQVDEIRGIHNAFFLKDFHSLAKLFVKVMHIHAFNLFYIDLNF